MEKVLIVILSVVIVAGSAFFIVRCTATEYNLVICYNNEVDENQEVSIKNNGLLPKLTAPTKEWHKFIGWYIEKDGTEIKIHDGQKYLIDGGKFKKKNYDIYGNEITIYAKYELDNINCFLEINGNCAQYNDQIITIPYGGQMPELEKLEKEFSTFKGWFTLFEGKEILIHNGLAYLNGYDLFVKEKYDIENYSCKIYAKFDTQVFDVNIFLDGQSEDFENRSILVTYGLTIEELPIPTKEHYVFTGWYTSKNGVEVLVHDGEKFTKNYNVISADRYTIVDDKVTLYAKYQIETIPVTFVYTNNGIDKQETIRIPYEGKIMDYAPSIINQYNEKSGFCWTLSPTDSIEKEIFVAVEEMTLYAVGSYIKFQNKYTAIESIDKSELLVDFRTSSSTNINAVYTVSSDLKRVIFIGDPSKTYTNFSIVVSASGERFELNLVDFKYSAQPRTVGLDASNLSNNSVLVINARGNAEIRGGDGKDGSSGASYDINNATKSPRSGGPGNNGESGSQALVCNNIEINIAINGSLKLFGGNGGDGGNGGHGEGSASDGIAQCGHGGNGGHGGAGGNAIEIRYKLVLNSLGNFSATGGNGADGGSGGNGGNNKDTGAFDRADHGGHGADGGNGGKGGVGIYINQNVLVEVINSSTIFATGGNGGKGGSGGSGGKSCKNEFQSSDGGNPGDAGSGGQGGMGGNSINYNDLSVIRKGGSGGYGGSAGTPGSAHNKIGEQGTDRSQTQASNGN